MAAVLTLELFVAGQPTDFAEATERIRRLLDQLPAGSHELRLINVLEQPELADLANVLVTPTLVVRCDGHERRLVGGLADLTKLSRIIADTGHL